MTLLIIIVSSLLALGVYDRFQRKHSIWSNFPIIGRLRNMLETIGPELRQYWVANNREELPFSRRQRSWIYASAKKQNNMSGFGSDVDMRHNGHIIIKHSMFPEKPDTYGLYLREGMLRSNRIIGEKRTHPYRYPSIVNISGMSFGALSGAAVESMNRGAMLAECYQNTGEGGLSNHHKHGGELVLQIGTGYFGMCNDDGSFSMEKLIRIRHSAKVKMIEIKLSQGAKPGKGGILPAEKMTQEIADARGIQMGKAAVSPSYHSQFSNVKEMVDFIENIAEKTGLPVGIKSAVGKLDEWIELAAHMKETGRGPDFITIDGGEGGTGAAPPSFADHMSLPFFEAFKKVKKVFDDHSLNDVVFIGSGKLGFPAAAIHAFSLGVDIINVGREAMMSIGCIQAQVCHTNRCPAGVATQNKWLTKGLDPDLKSVRCANYITTLRKEIMEMTWACGHKHPYQFTERDVEIK